MRVVLTGGRDVGVMEKCGLSGREEVSGSLTIGVLPSTRERVSKYVDLAIITEMGNARNNVNVMSSNVVVVCGLLGAGDGVGSRIWHQKPGSRSFLVGATPTEEKFFKKLGGRLIRLSGKSRRSHHLDDETVRAAAAGTLLGRLVAETASPLRSRFGRALWGGLAGAGGHLNTVLKPLAASMGLGLERSRRSA